MLSILLIITAGLLACTLARTVVGPLKTWKDNATWATLATVVFVALLFVLEAAIR